MDRYSFKEMDSVILKRLVDEKKEEYLSKKRAKELFDKTICFYTDAETELKRRLARDTTVRNRDASFILDSQQMRRQQYLQYYKEPE